MRRRLTGLVIGAVMAAGTALPAGSQTQPRSEPLPLDVAVSLQSHNGRSPIDLSPDGEWIAHTIGTNDTVARDSVRYSTTGVPFAEGDSRMEATVTHTRTGESIRLGGAASSSWAATWSPDGTRVAFYSDADGEAGLWVWELTTRRAARVGDRIVRPFFGFEKPRWSPDGRGILVKALPAGQSVAEANAQGPQPAQPQNTFPEVVDGEASVWVRAFNPEPEDAVEEATDPEPDSPPGRRPPTGSIYGITAELVMIDVETGDATNVSTADSIRGYSLSPDGRRVAYSVDKGIEPATQQPNYDLFVHDLATGADVQLRENARLGYGIEFSWSPDSTSVAWFPSGQMARQAARNGAPERVFLADALSGDVRSLDDAAAPSFDPGDGEHRPLWTATGDAIFGLGDGALWRARTDGSGMEAVAGMDGWRFVTLVNDWHADTAWLHDGNLWAVARAGDGSGSGLVAIDAMTGVARLALQKDRTYSGTFNVDGSSTSGEIAFVATDQQSLHDVWLFDTADDERRKATSVNPDLERYALGEARLLNWRSLDGTPLGGALLLPPGYEEGTPLPLVVWVYGGSMGSTYVNRFGFWGSLPAFNMHVLATRGYAVLFPDAPLEIGSPARDLMNTVMPGVNAAIEAGYADPERLAIMGQSYGSFNTLSIITRTPRFKAAVITAAVLHPDLFADYLGSIGYYEQGQGNMGGSIWEYPERYRENSPIFRFDRIETPLLIGQGETDGDLEPTNAIYNALERLGKPVEARVYEGEGHVITERANVLDFWRRRLEFLADHLDLEVNDLGAVTIPER